MAADLTLTDIDTVFIAVNVNLQNNKLNPERSVVSPCVCPLWLCVACAAVGSFLMGLQRAVCSIYAKMESVRLLLCP